MEPGLPYFLQALDICREINDQRCVAYAINNIALVYTDLEEYDTALEYHYESLAMKKANGDKAGMGSSYGNLSSIYMLKDDYQTALSLSKKGLEILREINDLDGIISNLLGVGKSCFLLGKYDEAKPYLEHRFSQVV